MGRALCTSLARGRGRLHTLGCVHAVHVHVCTVEAVLPPARCCGHFATKSRAYSTTFGALRAARTTAMRRASATADQPELVPEDEPDTVLVVGTWTYAGTGWRTSADAALALAAADAARSRRPAVPQSPA